ncbi:MAG: hypothetical protein EPN97_11100 [Alphaproteobacteria bacterium]|nr:MAG: hypothetical protein EPN97_11100 [Alphaproteobacteria bacterium]
MSLKNKANGEFKRYSKGPLYSELELHTVIQSLESAGYAKVEDNRTLGMAIYARKADGKETGTATIYLDSLGCDPLNSGIMMISDEKGARCTAVWTEAQEQRLQGVKNPLVRALRRIF